MKHLVCVIGLSVCTLLPACDLQTKAIDGSPVSIDTSAHTMIPAGSDGIQPMIGTMAYVAPPVEPPVNRLVAGGYPVQTAPIAVDSDVDTPAGIMPYQARYKPYHRVRHHHHGVPHHTDVKNPT